MMRLDGTAAAAFVVVDHDDNPITHTYIDHERSHICNRQLTFTALHGQLPSSISKLSNLVSLCALILMNIPMLSILPFHIIISSGFLLMIYRSFVNNGANFTSTVPPEIGSITTLTYLYE